MRSSEVRGHSSSKRTSGVARLSALEGPMVRLLWIGVVAAVLVAPGAAQSRRQGFTVSPGCSGWDGSHPSYCEDREATISAGLIDVDASPNGGIRIVGSDRPDVFVRA